MKEPGPFCPTCYSRNPWLLLHQFKQEPHGVGLDPMAHRGWTHGKMPIRRHGIVRIAQDIRSKTLDFSRRDPNGRRSIRVRARISRRSAGGPGSGVTGRTWATCSDSWHEDIRRFYDRHEYVEPRPHTVRPPKNEIQARRKDKARNHKNRQAKR